MEKLTVLFIVTFVLLSSLVYGGAVVSDFRGEPGINLVTLKWIVKAESNLKGYEVLRSFDGTSYEKIGFVEVNNTLSGEKTYTFSDKSVFKPTDRTFYYKLKFVDMDNSSQEYDKIIVLSPNISSARHTWGSIKAMFR